MNITGIRVKDEFYQYNNKKQKAERVQKIRHSKEETHSDPIENIYKLQPDDAMQQAIADMEKDDILMKYQFFVPEEKK